MKTGGIMEAMQQHCGKLGGTDCGWGGRALWKLRAIRGPGDILEAWRHCGRFGDLQLAGGLGDRGATA